MNNSIIKNVSKNGMQNKVENEFVDNVGGVFGGEKREVKRGEGKVEGRVGEIIENNNNNEISGEGILSRGVEVEMRRLILENVMGVLDGRYVEKCGKLRMKGTENAALFIDFCFQVWEKGVSVEELEEVKLTAENKIVIRDSKKVWEENFSSKEGRSCFLVRVFEKFLRYFEFSEEAKKLERERMVKLFGGMLREVIEVKIKAEKFSEKDREEVRRYGDLVSVLTIEKFINEEDFYELFPDCDKKRLYGGRMDVVLGEEILLLSKSPKEGHRRLVERFRVDVDEYEEKYEFLEKDSCWMRVDDFKLEEAEKVEKPEEREIKEWMKDMVGGKYERGFVKKMDLYLGSYGECFYEELLSYVDLMMGGKHERSEKDGGEVIWMAEGIDGWVGVLLKYDFKCSLDYNKEKTKELLEKFKDLCKRTELKDRGGVFRGAVDRFGILLQVLKMMGVITEREKSLLFKEVFNFD